MSKRKALGDSLRTDDVCRELEAHPLCQSVRQNGTSHRIYKFQGGSIAVPVGHDKDLKRGTFNSIMRQVALLGLLALLIGLLLWLI